MMQVSMEFFFLQAGTDVVPSYTCFVHKMQVSSLSVLSWLFIMHWAISYTGAEYRNRLCQTVAQTQAAGLAHKYKVNTVRKIFLSISWPDGGQTFLMTSIKNGPWCDNKQHALHTCLEGPVLKGHAPVWLAVHGELGTVHVVIILQHRNNMVKALHRTQKATVLTHIHVKRQHLYSGCAVVAALCVLQFLHCNGCDVVTTL